MPALILVVDDDPVQRRLLEGHVRRFGHEAIAVEGGEAALARLRQTGSTPRIDLVLLDLVMPDLDGMGVLDAMRREGIDCPVIVQTAHGSVDTVISAMRAGAADFVVKPVGPERLLVSIRNALRREALEGEIRTLNRGQAMRPGFRDLSTASPAMDRVVRLGERAAKSGIPVLLEGESGTGKEVIARAIQAASDRRNKPFVTVNCGAIPPDLVESVLFGHEKGAFTGATEKHPGKFVEAHGGTLFLDEIGELPLDAQVKLLRALQEGEVDPVGGRKSVKVDFRLISATNRNLIDRVREGRFREDLFYRLNVFPIAVPPLRQRREEIPVLAQRFLARFAAEEGRRIDTIADDAMACLMRYDWPGNVRQLENAVFRAVVLAESATLTMTEFPQIAAQTDGFEIVVPPAPAALSLPTASPLPDRSTHEEPGTLRLVDEAGELRTLQSLEEEAIRFSLSFCRGQISDMARKLGIGRSTLYRRMKEIGLATEADQTDTLHNEAA
jgi:DNA-binding NtrC family response regulator